MKRNTEKTHTHKQSKKHQHSGEKIFCTQIHIGYARSLSLSVCAKFFFSYSFNCSPVWQKYCRTSVTPPPSTSSFCHSNSDFRRKRKRRAPSAEKCINPKNAIFSMLKICLWMLATRTTTPTMILQLSDIHQNTTTPYLWCCMRRSRIYARLSDPKVSFSALQSYCWVWKFLRLWCLLRFYVDNLFRCCCCTLFSLPTTTELLYSGAFRVNIAAISGCTLPPSLIPQTHCTVPMQKRRLTFPQFLISSVLHKDTLPRIGKPVRTQQMNKPNKHHRRQKKVSFLRPLY